MKYIYILSDSFGETAERVVNAVTSQFTNSNFEIKKYAYLNDSLKIVELIKNAKDDNAMVVFTTVIDDVAKNIVENCDALEVPYIDLMGPLVDKFKDFLEDTPSKKPGMIYKLDKSYFDMIKSIEFAVRYDDGQDDRGIELADIVLIGVSRTSKTPLSMLLAHRGMKVVNVPLVPEIPIPKKIFDISPSKIIGLKTNVDILLNIRKERAKSMGLDETTTYSNIDRINAELKYAEEIMDKIGCRVIDVSNRAIEETSNLIVYMFKNNIQNNLG